MHKMLTPLIASLSLILSGNAFAHTGPVAHRLIENNAMHLLMHTGMILLMGISAFFISRRVIQHLLTSKQAKH